MRILLDLQGAQAESRFRGIGRQTLSLAQAIARNGANHEVHLFLNAFMSEMIDPIRAAFVDLIPSDRIHIWNPPFSIGDGYAPTAWRRDAAECLREAFILNLEPDIVHISSVFEGFCDDNVGSIGTLTPDLPTVVTLHDLIPLANPSQYFKPYPEYEKHYNRKLEFLKKADGYLVISEYSAQEGIDLLNLKREDMAIISGGCDEVFKKMDISSAEKNNLFSSYEIDRDFVLYSGGADPRKNLQGLIEAYARLDQSIRSKHQLVIVGKILPGLKAQLMKVATQFGMRRHELVFTGYVSDKELAQFYNLCRLFVFPSLHEGFGLPPLEAMNCGAPVIASNTSSIPEVMGNPEALFDPLDNQSITDLMFRALTDDFFRQNLIKHAGEQIKQFSWDLSGQKAVAFFEKVHAEHLVSHPIKVDLIESLATLEGVVTDQDLKRVAQTIDKNGGT